MLLHEPHPISAFAADACKLDGDARRLDMCRNHPLDTLGLKAGSSEAIIRFFARSRGR